MTESPSGAADWGYRGRDTGMRYSADLPLLDPSMTIEPTKEVYLAGVDDFCVGLRVTNPGDERTVIASAWVMAAGHRLYLPDLIADEQFFTFTLPGHSSLLFEGIVNLRLPFEVPPMEVEIGAELVDATTGYVISSPAARVRIDPYVPPSGVIVVEGPIGASWQTFSYIAGPSSLKLTPLWIFDDGETSEQNSPGHLFLTTGDHQLGLILTDEVGSQFLVTTSTIVMERAGHCGGDMANMGGLCIDRYEASRTDATAFARGEALGAAVSIRGVLPWQPESAVEVASACALAGKRLCSLSEWQAACKGSFGQSSFLYPYGVEWEYMTCSDYYTYADGVVFTGKFEECRSRAGVYDMIGNVQELVTDDQGTLLYVMGGSTYGGPAVPTCETSQDIEPQPWGRGLAYGFRCCKDAE